MDKPGSTDPRLVRDAADRWIQAEPTFRIRALRLRLTPGALERGDTALRDAVRRQLPAHLDPAVAEPLAAELARSARRAASGARERS